MVLDESIIELGEWLRTPPGLCLLHWEQARLDQAVADVFGYHALQLGLPELQGLRSQPHAAPLGGDRLDAPGRAAALAAAR